MRSPAGEVPYSKTKLLDEVGVGCATESDVRQIVIRRCTRRGIGLFSFVP